MALTTPGPSADEIQTLLTLGARAPDHGKLAPWRFVVIDGEAKADFVTRLEVIAASRPESANLLAKLSKLRVPPLTVAVISRYVAGKIPEWEQRLSAGAVCAQLLMASQALGYGANWITDWYAYDPDALTLLGVVEGEKVAGFIHIGTPTEAPLERVRPELQSLVTVWGR
jgi:nitroreductase